MWHGPFGLYGWIHDEEAEGRRKHLVHWRGHLHGIPRALICRRFGHRPVVDGYGEVGATYPGGQPRAKRWVACGRCDTRPAWQGDLLPALFPDLGVPYDGEWVTEDAFATSQAAMIRRKDAHYQAILDARAAGEPPPTQPVELYPMWPSEAWEREGEERPGPRGEVSFELLIGAKEWHGWPGIGAEVSLGTGETPIDAHVHLGPVGSLYLGFGGYGRSLAHRLFGRDMPPTRVWNIELDGLDGQWTLHWQIGARRNEWSNTDPKWTHGRINFAELLLGKASCTREAIDSRDVMIPLPEGRYPATVRLERVTWKRERTRAQVHYSAEVEPACGVPVPGKGENSYDCGDDATYSQSGPSQGPEYGSEWVTEAVAAISESVLRSRSRYGSGLAWTPDAGWPEQCVRA